MLNHLLSTSTLVESLSPYYEYIFFILKVYHKTIVHKEQEWGLYWCESHRNKAPHTLTPVSSTEYRVFNLQNIYQRSKKNMQLSPINNNSTTFKGYTDIKARRFINGYKKFNRSKINDVNAKANAINISYNKLHNNVLFEHFQYVLLQINFYF